MADKLGDLVIGIAGDLNPLKGTLNSATKMLDNFGSGLKSFIASAAPITAGVLGAGVAGDLAGGVRDLVTESIKFAAGLEKSTTQFEVLLGNASDARDLLADMKSLGVETGMGFKVATSEAAKLLAAGVTKEQIFPTLSMLSDIAMGDKQKISRAALAYGQVRATGYVQGDEANQLAELGIPVKKAIADFKGVAIEEYAALQEARQITFRDLQGGLKLLTSEGGKFYGMTARGSETLEGTFAKLEDAIEDLKRAFGQAVIEEFQLKDMLKDGAKFAGEMKDFIDDTRPGIRFVGDVLKGAGNVMAELARNGPLFGRALTESIRGVSPELADLFDKVGNFVESLKSFKLDPHGVVDAAADFGIAFGTAIESVLKAFKDGLGDIYTTQIKPIVDSLNDAAATWKAIKGLAAMPGDFGDRVGRNSRLVLDTAAGKKPAEAAFIADVEKEYGPIKKAFLDGTEPFRKSLEAARGKDPTAEKLYTDLLTPINLASMKVDTAIEQLAKDKYTFRWNPDYDKAAAAAARMPDREKDVLNSTREMLAAFRQAGVNTKGWLKINGMELEAATPAMAGPASKAKAFVDDLRASMHKLADDFAVKRDALADPLKGGLAGLIGGPALLNPADAKKAREAFKLDDPAALKRPSEIKLPTAAEYGSAAAAELIARTQASQADGWQRLAAIEQQQVELLAKIEQGVRKGEIGKVPTLNIWPW